MKKRQWWMIGLLLLAPLGGCAVVAGAAVGGIAGYEMAKHGYVLRSPIVKAKSDSGQPASRQGSGNDATTAGGQAQALPPPQPLSSAPLSQ